MRRQLHVEQRNRPSAGNDYRAQLLAGIPVTERRMDLAGISTAVLEGGDGPPIVLLHGPGEFAGNWMWVIPDLVTTHRVIAPDLPGHGTSVVEEGPLDADRALAWLGALIERLCPSPPTVVGHVLGGAIAARFAVDHGERLERLVLVDTLGLAPFQPTPAFGQALTEFLAQPTEHTYDRFMRQCAFDLDSLQDVMGERWEPFAAYNLDLAQTPSVKAAMDTLFGAFGIPAIPPADLARIAVPTTLIWGRHDRATALPVAEAASARYGWPLHVVENAADDPARDQPEAFLRALRVALETVTGAEVDA